MPTPQDDLTVGVALRAAREDAGRTVEQLASRTNIRATLIRDLEEDRFESCGGRVYARGHVKSIASALSVDAAPLLALFDKAQPEAEPALAGLPTVVVPSHTEESLGGTSFALASAAALRPERRGPRWGLALAGAAAVLGVVTLVGYQDQPGAASRATVFDTAGPTPSATATQAPVVTPSTPSDLSAAKPPVTGAQLRLRVIGGQSWVSVSNATATLFEGILSDGQFRDFNDPTRLKVVVGNAGAVNLNCGGRDSGPAGGSGKVGHFACTAAGLTAT